MTNQDQTPDAPREPKLIIASGGVLSKLTPSGVKIAVIYRPGYKDWTLPKGKVKEKESIQEAALREVLEETNCQARIESLAGASTYSVKDAVKTVYFWNMTVVKENEFKPTDEVKELLWLSPQEAAQKLTHEDQRRLVAQATKPEREKKGPFARFMRYISGGDLRSDRLRGSIQSYRTELEGKRKEAISQNKKTEWHDKSLELLEAAEYHRKCGKIDVGWQCFHAAVRLEVFTMDETALASKARNLKQESEKIREWRKKAVEKILEKSDEKEDKYEQKQIFEAMLLIHEHYNNVYYKIGLFRRQLTILAAIFLFLILLIVVLAFACKIPSFGVKAWPQSILIVGVIILGILGAALSSFFSIIKTPKESTVPDQVASWSVTAMRVLVGAASALIVFVLVNSSLFKAVFDFEADSNGTILFLAFVSGYSERLVQKAVGKISGEK